MIEGSCHCGNISFRITQDPKWLTDCNCSICGRLGTLWGHIPMKAVTIKKKGETTAYAHGDKNLAFHTCMKCGCTTHWENLKPEEYSRMAVNFRMCTTKDRSKFRVRNFDGADTWKFLD